MIDSFGGQRERERVSRKLKHLLKKITFNFFMFYFSNSVVLNHNSSFLWVVNIVR